MKPIQFVGNPEKTSEALAGIDRMNLTYLFQLLSTMGYTEVQAQALSRMVAKK